MAAVEHRPHHKAIRVHACDQLDGNYRRDARVGPPMRVLAELEHVHEKDAEDSEDTARGGEG